MSTESQEAKKPIGDARLSFAAQARCGCGAGMAYPLWARAAQWDCGDVLTGRVPDDGQHTVLPFVFYDVKSEAQPSANGQTTRHHPMTEDETKERTWCEAFFRHGSLSMQIDKLSGELERAVADHNAAVEIVNSAERSLFNSEPFTRFAMKFSRPTLVIPR